MPAAFARDTESAFSRPICLAMSPPSTHVSTHASLVDYGGRSDTLQDVMGQKSLYCWEFINSLRWEKTMVDASSADVGSVWKMSGNKPPRQPLNICQG